jgi:hypothetical protein
MKLRCIICLIAITVIAPQTRAQATDDELQTKLDKALTENQMLKTLVVELTAVTKQLTADQAALQHAIDKIKQDHLKAEMKRQNRTLEYKLALAENKMLKARVESLLRLGGSSTSQPATGSRSRRNVRLIAITLHEELWKWWTDPLLLTKHIALRRKLEHLDVDHSIDAWLTRQKEFAGTKVNWSMKLVSGSFTSKSKIDKAWKEADQTLTDTIQGAVFGNTKPVNPRKAKLVGQRPTTRPAPKPRNNSKVTNGYSRPKRADFSKQIRELKNTVELYKRASAAGGMTTIYAVSGNIAVKMSLPGLRFEKLSMRDRPDVQITGVILSAAPKAGYFAGRNDSMMQFVVTGECKLTNPTVAPSKPK